MQASVLIVCEPDTNQLTHFFLFFFRHGCPELCINVVNNMYGYNAMEVQEAFVKIREQVGGAVVCWL